MKKITFLVLFFALFVSYAQNPSFADIKFWIGSGEKVAMFVVDFNDGATNECYAWGYRFDGDDATAMDMLDAIATADPNFSFASGGSFVNDIHYLTHSGIGGNPYYWSTFSYQNEDWIMNNGFAEVLTDSSIFGNSYTDWDVNYNPINLPESPIAAKKPFFVNSDEVVYWVGNGAKKAYLVVDFNDQASSECYIWGYKFDDENITVEQMISDITNSDYHLSISMTGGFISDVAYQSQNGLGGNPFYWSSFTLINQLWEMNLGIVEGLQDNMVFGISYTDWDADYNPIYEPENAVPAPLHTHISEQKNISVLIYPNPSKDMIFVEGLEQNSQIRIYASNGNLVYRSFVTSENIQVDISKFSLGTYILKVENGSEGHRQIFIKQ